MPTFNFTWIVTGAEFIPDTDTIAKLLFRTEARLLTNAAFDSGAVAIAEDLAGSNFAEASEEQKLEWLFASLSPEERTAIETELEGRVRAQLDQLGPQLNPLSQGPMGGPNFPELSPA
jgi:hypothetical protein